MLCYRLKELIISKYGKNKYETGKQIVAQWLSKETGHPVSAEAVQQCCDANIPEEFYVSPEMVTALLKLFGLKLPEELVTLKSARKAPEIEEFLIIK